MHFNIFLALGLFVAASFLDAVFALYTVAVVNLKPYRAASLSFLTYMLEAVGVVNYVKNKWYLIPLALGAYVGSFIIVKWEADKKIRQEKKDDLEN